MDWERFEPSDGILRAQGNGYSLNSVSIRSVGIMVEFFEIQGYGMTNDPLAWLTPVIPDRTKEKVLMVPCAAADKMVFGILPGVGSSLLFRDFKVSTLADIAGMVRYFTQRDADDGIVHAFESGEWRLQGWCGGVADLLPLIAPMMYRPQLGITGVPRPDDEGVFRGVTSVGSAFVSFVSSVTALLSTERHRNGKDLKWLYTILNNIQTQPLSLWSQELDLLDLYYRNDSARGKDGETRHLAYDLYMQSTNRLTKLLTSVQLPSGRTWYYFLIQYHLRWMFTYDSFIAARAGNDMHVKSRDPAYPSLDEVRSDEDIWQGRMQVYFQRLPSMVLHMLSETGLGKAGLLSEQGDRMGAHDVSSDLLEPLPRIDPWQDHTTTVLWQSTANIHWVNDLLVDPLFGCKHQ